MRGDAYGLGHPLAALFSIWRECFGHLLCTALRDGCDMDVDLCERYDEVYELLRDHYQFLDQVEEPKLVRWDLWDGDILVDAALPASVGVIDLERGSRTIHQWRQTLGR